MYVLHYSEEDEIAPREFQTQSEAIDYLFSSFQECGNGDYKKFVETKNGLMIEEAMGPSAYGHRLAGFNTVHELKNAILNGQEFPSIDTWEIGYAKYVLKKYD